MNAVGIGIDVLNAGVRPVIFYLQCVGKRSLLQAGRGFFCPRTVDILRTVQTSVLE